MGLIKKNDISYGGGDGTGTTPSISATASVGTATGTPSVDVTRTGTDEAPSFAFAFDGLKGESGSSTPQTLQEVTDAGSTIEYTEAGIGSNTTTLDAFGITVQESLVGEVLRTGSLGSGTINVRTEDNGAEEKFVVTTNPPIVDMSAGIAEKFRAVLGAQKQVIPTTRDFIESGSELIGVFDAKSSNAIIEVTATLDDGSDTIKASTTLADLFCTKDRMVPAATSKGVYSVLVKPALSTSASEQSNGLVRYLIRLRTIDGITVYKDGTVKPSTLTSAKVYGEIQTT